MPSDPVTLVVLLCLSIQSFAYAVALCGCSSMPAEASIDPAAAEFYRNMVNAAGCVDDLSYCYRISRLLVVHSTRFIHAPSCSLYFRRLLESWEGLPRGTGPSHVSHAITYL